MFHAADEAILTTQQTGQAATLYRTQAHNSHCHQSISYTAVQRIHEYQSANHLQSIDNHNTALINLTLLRFIVSATCFIVATESIKSAHQF